MGRKAHTHASLAYAPQNLWYPSSKGLRGRTASTYRPVIQRSVPVLAYISRVTLVAFAELSPVSGQCNAAGSANGRNGYRADALMQCLVGVAPARTRHPARRKHVKPANNVAAPSDLLRLACLLRFDTTAVWQSTTQPRRSSSPTKASEATEPARLRKPSQASQVGRCLKPPCLPTETHTQPGRRRKKFRPTI